MTPGSTSSLSLLDRAFEQQWDEQIPLHTKVHRGLRYAIENFFEDGQRFFTEKEIIEHLKVSQVTVRRAIYDLVRDGMLERRVAKGSFVRKRAGGTSEETFTVAVHIADWNSSFLSELLHKILGACYSQGLEAKVFYSQQSGAVVNQGRTGWKQTGISAAILVANPLDISSRFYRVYAGLGKKIVAVDTKIPDAATHFVGTDNHAVINLGLDHLTSLGHERICLLVNEPGEHNNVIQQAKFFEEAKSKRQARDWQVMHCGTKFWENSYTKVYQIMPKVMGLKPTAIFALSDVGAWGALAWCSQHGVKVPLDVSIMGIGNEKPSTFTHPALTTIAHPVGEIASMAVDLTTLRSETFQTRLLQPMLVVRESTASVG